MTCSGPPEALSPGKSGGPSPPMIEDMPAGSLTVSSGVTATSSTLATAAGLMAYAHGGNAIDAAIASAFALFVVEPDMSHLAGQAHILVHLEHSKETHHIDAYSIAPAAAHPEMYEWLKQPTQGDYRYYTKDDLNDTGPLSVAVPATLLGLERLHAVGAKLPWGDLVRPAIELAENGFRIGPALAHNLETEWRRLARFSEFRKVFGSSGQPLAVGGRLRQPELAETLRTVAARGASVLYEGPLAFQMVSELGEQGGLVTTSDLETIAHRVDLAPPLAGEYLGHTVRTSGPSTAGGQLLLLMLAHHERSLGSGRKGGSPEEDTSLRLAAMRDAFARRLAINEAAAEGRVSPVIFDPQDLCRENNTTHHSHMDEAGNTVAVTQSIGDPFGSGIILKGTGILLNNAMKLFDPRPDRPNSVRPGRKVISTMTPTIVLLRDQPVLALGSPSGTRIVNAVFQVLANLMSRGMSFGDSVRAARLHWNGVELEVENDHPEAEMLAGSVSRVIRRERQDPWFGLVQLAGRIGLDPRRSLTWATDPRRTSAGGGLASESSGPSAGRRMED